MPSKREPRCGTARRRKTQAASTKVARKTAARKATTKPAGKAKQARSSRPKSSRDKVKAYRQRMRAKGFRLLQMWLPDTNTPEFRAQAHKDALAIANSPTEAEDQAFIDSVSWLTSEEAEALAEREPPPEQWWREPSD